MEAEGETRYRASSCQSTCEVKMAKNFLTDSDEEVIVEWNLSRITKYSMTRHMSSPKTKARWIETLTNRHKLSVQVCKTWFEFQRTRYGKLMQSKSSKAPRELTGRQHWIHNKFHFLKSHIRRKGIGKPSEFCT